MNYTVVFDVLESGYRMWWVPVIGLISTVATLLMGIYWDTLPPHRSASVFMRFAPFAFVLFWTAAVFLTTSKDYQNLADCLRNDRCQVVEGQITDFVPMPVNGHKDESFIVDGQRFTYSDFVGTAGFNHTRSQGGPIHNGIHVRIHHVGNEIARWEIARDP